MKAKTRLKFLLGIAAVILLCGALFVYLDFSMSRIASVDAQLDSDIYTIGIDYSGIIEKQYIDEGAYIKTNDPLFELRSSTLSEAIRNNEVAKSSLLYTVKDDGLVLISAAAPGQVQSIAYRQGAFVPANSQIAVVNSEDKLFVSATYKLSAPDYARLDTSSKISITFPDNKTVQGSVYDISLKTVDREVLTTVRARFDQDAVNKVAFSVGTPVKTVLYLNSDSWLNRITTDIRLLFQPKSGN